MPPRIPAPKIVPITTANKTMPIDGKEMALDIAHMTSVYVAPINPPIVAAKELSQLFNLIMASTPVAAPSFDVKRMLRMPMMFLGVGATEGSIGALKR
tara:strand:- start:7732 stop:8025 length:294 start_codon:yes stop_codon:yes gene_type:complete